MTAVTAVRTPLARVAMLPFLAAFAVLLAGCGRGPADERPEIALVMKSLANEFFQTMERGAREHQAARADQYDLVVNGIKDELDVSRQIDLVEQMIARRVDAIVIAPADSRALVPVLRRAVDAGLVVVNIDNRLHPDVLAEQRLDVPFVGPDNRKGARAVGAFVASKLQRGDPIAILEGVPNAENGVQRALGFRDAAEEAGLRIVASQAANWESSIANQVAAAILTAHPGLKAFLCANDSMALGALAATRAAGRDDVLVAGFDNISAAQALLREGRLVATADQHADQLAVFGIEYALEILRTGAAPMDRETPVDLITAPAGR